MSDPKIKKTSNYFIFQKLEANRQINENHVEALMAAFKKQYFISPIQVNENMQVIDGQHRLEAAKRLGFAVYYIQLEGATIKTVQALNTNSRNWTNEDYLNCYVKEGYKDYIIFNDFINEYGFKINAGQIICSGSGYQNARHFASGQFKILDINKAYEIANKINRIRAFYDGWKRSTFVRAIIICAGRKNFSIEEFVHKLSLQGNRLRHCANVEQYIELIEQIYNYKRSDKINLRIATKD